MLKTNASLLCLLALPAVLLAGGFVMHQALLSAVVGITGVVVIASWVAQQGSDARSALRFGMATNAQVTGVRPVGRGASFVTLKVDGPGGPAESTLGRSGGANVLVEGDTVQVMVDPQTRQVLLVLGLLKPSPLYAPPSS